MGGGGHILWVLNREIYVKDPFFTNSLTGSYLIIDSLQKPARSFIKNIKKGTGRYKGEDVTPFIIKEVFKSFLRFK